MVRGVAGQVNSHYKGKEKSLAVFLNQVLLDRKPCPDKLAELLVEVAGEALAARSEDAGRAQTVQDELRLVLSAAGPGGDPIGPLLVRQLQANEVVIVNPDTLEGRGHPRSTEFQDAMFRTILHGEGKYTTVLDRQQHRAAERHWEATFRALMPIMAAEAGSLEIERSTVDAKINQLEEDGRLSVFAVEPSWCIVPLVAFDPGSRDLCDVFVWDWWLTDGHPVDEVARLSKYVTWKWIEDFYNGVLGTRDEARRPMRRRYDDVRRQVR